MANWAAEARAAAIAEGLDPDLFERQMRHESANYDPAVISGQRNSSAGAQGIAQFMPGTARGLGINPLNPRQALRGAARLMKSYVQKYGSYRNALVAYNAGPGRVGGALPAETQKYIQIIMGNSGASSSSPTKLINKTYLPGDTGPTNDIEGAIMDTLAAHKGGSLARGVLGRLASGQYTIPGTTVTSTANNVGGIRDSTGALPASVDSIINRANIIDSQHRKYLYGGGHGGATLNNPTPLDCSAAVSLATGLPVRTSGQFNTVGQPGKGLVNIYYNSGHVFMSVVRNGKEMFWGTSGFGHPSKGTGAGWFTVDPSSSYLSGFQVRHLY